MRNEPTSPRIPGQPFRIDWRFILTLLAVFIVVYGYAIFNYSITIDNEAEFLSNHDKWYLACRRWGVVFLRHTLFAPTVTPFASMVTTAIALSLAAVAISSAIRWQTTLQRYVFGIIFLIFPQFAYHIQFTLQIDSVAIGILASALGYKAFRLYEDTRQRRYLLLSALGFTCGISTYQSILFIPAILFAADQINRLTQRGETPDNPSTPRTAFLFGIVLAASVLAYYACTYASLALLHMPFANGYLDSMVMWKQDAWQTCLHRTVQTLIAHLTGRSYLGELFYISIWIPAALLAHRLFSKKTALSWNLRLWGLLLMAGIILLPFAQIVIMADDQPARVFLAQSCALAAMWALGYNAMGNCLRHHRLLIPVTACLLAIATLKASYLVSGWFHTDHAYNQAEQLVANRIVDRIHAVGASHGYTTGQTPVVFLGNYDVKQAAGPINPNTFRTGDTFGCRFLNDECYGRRYTFIAISLISALKPPTPEEIDKARNFMQDAPVWPHPDSVRYQNGIMAVKLNRNMQ